MEKTPFAGLTQLDPGEPFSTDGYSFQHENPPITDRLLEVGAIGHRHDAHAALADPSALPVLANIASGGNILSDTALWATYTLLDADGGETRPATAQSLTTPAALDPPDDSPAVALDTTSGTLLANTYVYALTLTDGSGGETTIGPSAMITRPTGPANAHITVSGMTAIMAAAGAAGWRLWRSVGGGRFGYLAQGTGDTFNDDGVTSPDCTMNPPTRNTTSAVNTLRVTVPGGQPAGATQFRVYLSLDGSFESPAVAGTYPIADAGTPINYPTINLADGSPPDVSLSLPGASKINPATDILAADSSVWEALGASGGGGGGGGGGGTGVDPDNLTGTFAASGLPYAIPDNTGTFHDVDIVVTGGGTVGSVVLALQVTHTFSGDVVVELAHPDGTTVVLTGGDGGSRDNIGTPGVSPPNFSFDDAAATSINDFTGSEPAGAPGAYRPEQPLWAFRGKTAAGTWKLKVRDKAGGDTGTLNAAELRLSATPNTWKYPVANAAALPMTGNSYGDVRVTLDDNLVRTWGHDGAWHTGGLTWQAITLFTGYTALVTDNITAISGGFSAPEAAVDPNGIVHLRGAIAHTGAWTLFNIGRVPVGCRPPLRKRLTAFVWDISAGHAVLGYFDIVGENEGSGAGGSGTITWRGPIPHDDTTTEPSQIHLDGITYET